jgi:putative ABC transport system permease protein
VRDEPEWVNVVTVKTRTDRLYEAIDLAEQEYAKLEQIIPFEVSFMDERLENLYSKERQMGQLSTGLSLVAVFLAVLGLLGLVSFMTHQRRGEISVRKIFGASVAQIMLLINREFAILVALATLLAAPLAYFGIDAWLDNFAYRISPGLLGIAGVGLISLLVVVLVVSVQSFRTARQNPAQTLMEE